MYVEMCLYFGWEMVINLDFVYNVWVLLIMFMWDNNICEVDIF